MKLSFQERPPGEASEAPRSLIGFLSKSQSVHGYEREHAPYGANSESEDDDHSETFHYPGMPREPKPIKLTDPYPGGRLAGSKSSIAATQDVQPLVHDGSTTILFVKAGSEHRALLYLMQKVNRYFALDDMLPEVPPEIAAYHYLMLAPPRDGPTDGDASTSFRNSTLFLLSGMVLRRVKVRARDIMTIGLVDSVVVQRRLPMRKLAARLATDETPASAGGGGGHREGGGISSSRKSVKTPRLASEPSMGSDTDPNRRETKRWMSARRTRRTNPPELIPVAIFSAPLYLDTAGSIIRNFNRTGLIVTPYLYSTVVAASAVCTIQGWWRSHLIRGLSNFGELLQMSRAARKVQRAFRAYLLRSRLEMLSSMRRLVASVGCLLLGANLALTAGHCMALRERAGRPRPAALFPEQRLRFAMDRAGALMLVEPERMMPKPNRDGNWCPGLTAPPVPRSLPEWCGVPLVMSGERAAVTMHGCREVLGMGSVLQLLTRDTVWRDNTGVELPRTTLPDTTPPDPGAAAATFAGGGTLSDVVLAVITFPSVHEAAVRAALLSVYTWDPLRHSGVNLVPLHQTAAARGVQAQAALAHAIQHIAASAGHLVTVPASPPPQEAAAAAAAATAGGLSGSMCSLTSVLSWRHAPPGSRERQRGVVATTPTRELRSPIWALGSGPQQQQPPSGLGSPLVPSGAASGGSSFSQVHSGGYSRSQSHLQQQQQSRGSSPSRAVSPPRQRGIGGGGSVVAVPGSPGASPGRRHRSPLLHPLPSRQGGHSSSPRAAAMAGLPPVSPVSSPQRWAGKNPPTTSPFPLPPVATRPGTVPLFPISKFFDLAPSAAAAAGHAATAHAPAPVPQLHPAPVTLGATGTASTSGRDAMSLVLRQRPRTTPVTRAEGEINSGPSFAGGELTLLGGIPSATPPHRSPGGLYGTHPGAPLPADNLPLSSLALALNVPYSNRPSTSHSTSPARPGSQPYVHDEETSDVVQSRDVSPTRGGTAAADQQQAKGTTWGVAVGTASAFVPTSVDDSLPFAGAGAGAGGGVGVGGENGNVAIGVLSPVREEPYRGYDMTGGVAERSGAGGAESPVLWLTGGDGNMGGGGGGAGGAGGNHSSAVSGSATTGRTTPMSTIRNEASSPTRAGAEGLDEVIAPLDSFPSTSPSLQSPVHLRAVPLLPILKLQVCTPEPQAQRNGVASGELSLGQQHHQGPQDGEFPQQQPMESFPGEGAFPPPPRELMSSAAAEDHYAASDVGSDTAWTWTAAVTGVDPLSQMTVLQRHQAMGLGNDWLLWPVPRRRPGAEVETAAEAGVALEVDPEEYFRQCKLAMVQAQQQQQQEAFPGSVPSFDPTQLQPQLTPPGGPEGLSVGLEGGELPLGPSDTADPAADNPELAVTSMTVGYLHPPTVAAELVQALGNKGREERYIADCSVRIGKMILAEEHFTRHRQLMSTLMLTQVIGRQSVVGHVHAPNYMPMSVGAMNQIVSEMRRVYRGEAAELVSTMREQHKEATKAIKQELANTARLVAAASCMQAAVVDSELTRQSEERERAVRSRVTRSHLRALRRERATQDRAFAAAFGRQVAGASKQVVRSEIRARDAVLTEVAAAQGTLRRQLDVMAREHITKANAEMAASNRIRASQVRGEGWTPQVATHYHLLNQWQADIVALRRDENYARMRLIGPAGGVWGAGRPRELLRAPLPMTNVVSAVVAAEVAAVAGEHSDGASATALAGAVTPATGAWRSISASDVRHNSVTYFVPLDGGEADRLFTATTGARVSFGNTWSTFEGDHGSMATSSAPPSALPSRQTANRRPLPQPLPDGYVPGGAAAATPPPLIEDSEAATSQNSVSHLEGEIEGESMVAAATGRGGTESLAAPPIMRPGARAASLAAMAVANGLRARGSPPRNLVEGPDGRLVDFLPEAYPVQPFGSRQANPPRPVGMVVSRY